MTPQKIATDYQESFNFLQAKKKRQAAQLVLLNNIRRGDEFIASTLLLTIFNRVMASLYDDKIQVKFLPSQGINQDQINAYNILAQSDYQEMNKAKLDYDWCWDTLFFGRGYVETLRFDKKRKIMQPHVINPLAFGYDPYFDNPQDWRYYWKWVTKSKYEIDALIKAGVLKNIKKAEDLPSGIDPYLWQYKIRVDQARDGIAPPIAPADNSVFQILEYFGYNEKGKKSVYWTDKHASKIIFEQELDLEDGEEIIGPDGTVVEVNSKWPIVVKEAFREPHSSIPFSVADLLEDKHRAKSVLLNLTYIAAKDQANPIYGYNPDKIRDVTQFFSRQINQHIPMDDEAAAWPLNKAGAMPPELINFMTILQQEANDPIGTGVKLEPSAGGQETATEVAIDQQMNDLAQSLQSKVLQFGEAEFWSHWFHRYSKHADDLGEKMANIVGVKGVDTKIIDLKHFKTDYAPGIHICSAKEAEYKNLVKRRDFMTLYPNLAQTLDPDGFRNFNKHVFFPLMIEDPSLIDVMFPKDMDEIKAEEENIMLRQNQMPDVSPTDNHTTHIYSHRMLNDKTWAAWMHTQWHEEMLAEQKKQEMLEQSMQQMEMGQPQISDEKRSPMGAASPLKAEIKTKQNIKK
jgi:hypothetical protein